MKKFIFLFFVFLAPVFSDPGITVEVEVIIDNLKDQVETDIAEKMRIG